MKSGLQLTPLSPNSSGEFQTPTQGEECPPPPSLGVRQRRLISRVLAKALQLWLRSQVESVATLEVKITGGDTQILQGVIPEVFICASGAVYQGLHLGDIEISGSGIAVNLTEVLKGKPLRLQQTVPVVATLELTEAHLNASLQSPLLSNALTQLLLPLLPVADVTEATPRIVWHQAQIATEAQMLTLRGVVESTSSPPRAFVLRMGLHLASSHELEFVNPSVQAPPEAEVSSLKSFTLDLGSEVAIEELTLSQSLLACRGRIAVMP